MFFFLQLTLRNIEYKKRNKINSAATTASTESFTLVIVQNKRLSTVWTRGLQRRGLLLGYNREKEVIVTG